MKLRHYLKAYHNLPDFPRADDIYFELQQKPKYLKGESFTFLKMKEALTFKIDKKVWEEKIEELISDGLIEQADKANYKLIRE